MHSFHLRESVGPLCCCTHIQTSCEYTHTRLQLDDLPKVMQSLMQPLSQVKLITSVQVCMCVSADRKWQVIQK